jgi:hypothetical protein
MGLHFYAVVDADAVNPSELATEGAHVVMFRDLAAVVKPAPYVRVTPSDEDLENFVHVVDALAKHGPVLPAPPGTVFRNERVLERWLEVHYAKLHEALGIVEQRPDKRAPYDYVSMDLGA